jgi:hypothetical protein
LEPTTPSIPQGVVRLEDHVEAGKMNLIPASVSHGTDAQSSSAGVRVESLEDRRGQDHRFIVRPKRASDWKEAHLEFVLWTGKLSLKHIKTEQVFLARWASGRNDNDQQDTPGPGEGLLHEGTYPFDALVCWAYEDAGDQVGCVDGGIERWLMSVASLLREAARFRPDQR